MGTQAFYSASDIMRKAYRHNFLKSEGLGDLPKTT